MTSNCQNCSGCLFKIPGIHTGPQVQYELHITVKNNPTNVKKLKEAGYKLIEIGVDKDESESFPVHVKQLMTSIKITDIRIDKIVPIRMRKHIRRIKDLGIPVLRSKLESTLNYGAAITGKIEDQQYFEAHFVFYEDTRTIATISRELGLVGSRNLMKKEDSTVKIYTLREYKTKSSDFMTLVNMMKSKFPEGSLKEVIMEFCVHDSELNRYF